MTPLVTVITQFSDFKTIGDCMLPIKQFYPKVYRKQVVECASTFDRAPAAMTNPSTLWLYYKVVMIELDQKFIRTNFTKSSWRAIWYMKAFQMKPALYQDHVHLPSHLTYSRFVRGRNRAETVKAGWMIENENSIPTDAISKESRLLAFSISFTHLIAHSLVTCLVNNSQATLPF